MKTNMLRLLSENAELKRELAEARAAARLAYSILGKVSLKLPPGVQPSNI
jgi:hypothetical protein